ncbi:hypothetical protein HOG21_02285 [bacterium]|jgi:hypothetical protein|nr:hypothetical protein [bacterium]
MQNAGVTAHVAERTIKGKPWILRVGKKVILWVPSMTWLVGVYWLIGFLGVFTHQEIYQFGNQTAILISDMIYLMMSLLILVDIMKVSVPGIDNTWEAQMLNYVSMVMVVFFVLSFTTEQFKVFASPQFAIMTVVNFLAAFVAVKVNARTLKRTIDGRGASSDGDSNE